MRRISGFHRTFMFNSIGMSSSIYLLSAIALSGSSIVLAQDPASTQQGSASSQLEEVTVFAQRQPYRGFTPLKELPQNVEFIESDLLDDIGITRLDQALELSSSVAKQNTFGGLWDSFAIRGFAGDENVPSGYLVNGFRAARGFNGPRDSSNIERVEILKGPGSALFGRSEPGGTINLITKKPTFETEGYIAVSGASHDRYRIEGDYTTPVNDKIAFRINAAYEDADSFRDRLFVEKYAAVPSVLINFTEQTSLSYELELVDQKAPFDRGVTAVDNRLGVIPVSRYLGEPGDGATDIEATGHQLSLQHDLNATWSILTGVSYQETSFEGISSDPELVESRQTLLLDGQHLSRQRRFRTFDSEDVAIRFELSGQFGTGSLAHNIVVGADAASFELAAVQNRFRPPPVSSVPNFPNLTQQELVAVFNAIDIFNPVYGNLAEMSPFINTLEEQDEWGVYLQDQMDLSVNWKATLGVRYDDFEQDISNRRAGTKAGQSQTKTSPRAGLVYVVNDSLSLYTSYSEGFRSNTGSDVLGKPFQPEETESYEVGGKLSLADDRISGTIALYRMDKDGIIVADPVNPGFSQAGGEARSQGLEVDLTAVVNETLDLIFSYAYVDAEFTTDVADFNFGRFISDGSPLINIPENTVNLTIVKGFHLRNGLLSFVGNVTYVDDRLGETGVPEFELPDYTLAHISAVYAPSPRYEISGHINNLFDEEYYPNSFARFWVAPGADRTFKVRLKYSF